MIWNGPFGSGIALLFLGQLDGNAESLGAAHLLLNIGERSVVSGIGRRRSYGVGVGVGGVLGVGALSGGGVLSGRDWIWFGGV